VSFLVDSSLVLPQALIPTLDWLKLAGVRVPLAGKCWLRIVTIWEAFAAS